MLKTGPYGGLCVERVAYRRANGVELPAVLFVPSQRAGSPVVILGQTERVKREPYVTWALGAWRPAMTLDLFGTGEIAGRFEKGDDDAVVMKGGMGVWANDPVKCPWNSLS